MNTFIVPLTENITRVVHTFSKELPGFSSLIAEDFKREENVQKDSYLLKDGCASFKNKKGNIILKEIEHSLIEKTVYKYFADSDAVTKSKQTANGDVSYIEGFKKEAAGKAYEGKISFEVSKEEGLYGLGQHEDGIYNYNGKKEYLYQSNMKISIPFLISSKNYGIFIDTETAMLFESSSQKITFTLDTTNELSYYIIRGENFDEIIASLRALTGRATMLPRWAYGYIQSKERYESSKDLIDTVAKFKQSHIPLDCIVQDWCTWEGDLWGEKKADKKRFPNIKGLVDTLHKEHVKLMISIWPNMAEGGANLKEFREKELLLPNSNTYNAYSEEAREVYWKQCEEEWFSGGVDAVWCDNSEPFSDPDWNGETKRGEEIRYKLIVEESKKSMDWTRLNSYGLLHSKGIYENWRRTNNEKRVVNLTRSSYISGQKYGSICWSGDISAKWSTLQKQIVEGIKFSMSGMPYWTMDIGAFFVKTIPLWFWNGDYNKGVEDLGYRELYVRWLQFGAFLPVFRSHGTDTPREPWNFGSKGDLFYDTIYKFIKLRYTLMPYIYSVAADVYLNNATMLRSLMFDFAKDKKVKELANSFMLGKAILVCPVTEPMYYGENSTPLSNIAKTKEVYLPKGTIWYDFWTNIKHSGGQNLICKAALNTMPVFIKGGSIIPISEPIEYADNKHGEISQILIYSGEDGEFTLYNDDGDNYSYESGNFAAIKLIYKENEKTLTFGKVLGDFKYQHSFKIKLILGCDDYKFIDYRYNGEEETISVE